MRTVIEIGIAIFLAYIAYQNYKISGATAKIQKDKLRLDLFDRRHRVFRASQDLFSFIMREGKPNRDELFKFMANSSDAEFLFGSDIKVYLDEISEKGLKLIHLNERLLNNNDLSSEKRTEFANEIEQLEKWFGSQFKVSKDLFRKYLHFSIDKG